MNALNENHPLMIIIIKNKIELKKALEYLKTTELTISDLFQFRDDQSQLINNGLSKSISIVRPIIIGISATANKDDLEEAFNYNMNYFCQKPLNSEVLDVIINAFEKMNNKQTHVNINIDFTEKNSNENNNTTNNEKTNRNDLAEFNYIMDLKITEYNTLGKKMQIVSPKSILSDL